MRPLVETVLAANKALNAYRGQPMVMVDCEALTDLIRIADQYLRAGEAKQSAYREANLLAILGEVCERHDIHGTLLRSPRRGTDALAAIRQEFMSRAFDTGRYTHKQIGTFLGNRHPSTIGHGIAVHRERMDQAAEAGRLARAS